MLDSRVSRLPRSLVRELVTEALRSLSKRSPITTIDCSLQARRNWIKRQFCTEKWIGTPSRWFELTSTARSTLSMIWSGPMITRLWYSRRRRQKWGTTWTRSSHPSKICVKVTPKTIIKRSNCPKISRWRNQLIRSGSREETIRKVVKVEITNSCASLIPKTEQIPLSIRSRQSICESLPVPWMISGSSSNWITVWQKVRSWQRFRTVRIYPSITWIGPLAQVKEADNKSSYQRSRLNRWEFCTSLNRMMGRPRTTTTRTTRPRTMWTTHSL